MKRKINMFFLLIANHISSKLSVVCAAGVIGIHCCAEAIKSTSVSHAVELGDRFLCSSECSWDHSLSVTKLCPERFHNNSLSHQTFNKPRPENTNSIQVLFIPLFRLHLFQTNNGQLLLLLERNNEFFH